MAIIEIGGVPSEEDCVATGVTENATSLNRLECRAYIEALRLKYGSEPEGAKLSTKGNPHDFGTFYEVVCRYDPEIKAAWEYAYLVENGLARWLDVGMWAPVMYDRCQPVSIIRDPALWLRETNPGAHTSLERRDAVALAPA
jgi:hypothetical protein